MNHELSQGPKLPYEDPAPKAGSSGFDTYAANYDAELNKGLKISGESKEYFARGRLCHLRKRLEHLDHLPENILDFGCGTGSSTSLFFELLDARGIRGLDPSTSSLEVARSAHPDTRVSFATSGKGWESSCDLAFCNGVFHHIPPAERQAALATVRRTLKPGGLFAFWENNPWNPLTRLAMRLVPFDADAVLVWPHEARRLLRENGFEILQSDYLFFFPRFASPLRKFEGCLSWLPLGGQYLILCRRSD